MPATSPSQILLRSRPEQINNNVIIAPRYRCWESGDFVVRLPRGATVSPVYRTILPTVVNPTIDVTILFPVGDSSVKVYFIRHIWYPRHNIYKYVCVCARTLCTRYSSFAIKVLTRVYYITRGCTYTRTQISDINTRCVRIHTPSTRPTE